ncbi:MAG: peptidase T [Selenomonadaceae bacterium]|nr:peptidase T [Selenomonadaceae bacterium]
MDREKILKKFTSYIAYDTTSDGSSKTCPSTEKQRPLGMFLVEEMKALGMADVDIDENGYVMGTLPASEGMEKVPVLGLIAHMDTSPDAVGGPVKWRIEKAYSGGEIILNKGTSATNGKAITMSPKEFPELLDYKGQDIIVTDGTTLLGADDKAGITAIMSAVEYFKEHTEITHGKVRIAFTPDEEIGRSADLFDVKKFGADFAFTVDGGAVGGLEYECFNACNLAVRVNGRNVHTGDAKNKMINALTIASEWQLMLPQTEQPETTEGYEGFYHVHTIKGNTSEARMGVLIRDHDRDKFEKRKEYVKKITELLNFRYGEGTVEVIYKDIYYNMKEKSAPVMWIVDIAKEAMERAGITPVISPIRGGTDGARLSFMGLPCPNIFTGGMNYHGIYEYLPVPSLLKSAQTVVEIVKGVGKQRENL